MRFFRSCISVLLLFTTPVSFIDCREHHHKKHKHHHSKHKSKKSSKTIVQEKGLEDLHLWTYDEILRLLDEVESGKIEKKCSRDDCKKIDHFLALLAKEGQSSENPGLDRDIAELIPENNPPFENISLTGVSACIGSMSPAFYSYFSLKAFQTKSSHNSSWKKTKKFVHKHRKAIIIGIVVVVVVAVVVTVVVVTSAPVAGAVVSAVATGMAASESNNGNDPPSSRVIKEVIDDQLELVRELETENHDLSFEDKARELGSISAHNSLENFRITEDQSFKHEVIDREFSTDYATYYANGDLAYKEYECYAHQSQEAAYEFNKGFFKGVPRGAYDSGENLVEFAKDVSVHPIETSIQIYSSIKQLSELAKSGDWRDISETIAPEVYDLVTNWDNLSPSDRGELSGYAFGKYGADIIIPGAAGKLIARGAKTSRALMEIRLGCEAAETTLLLETSAIECTQKIGPTIRSKGEFMLSNTPPKATDRISIIEKIDSAIPAKNIAQIELLGFSASELEGSVTIKIQLNKLVSTSSDTQMLKFTPHALERAVTRKVPKDSIVEALEMPLKIEPVKIDALGRPSQRFIGQTSEVVINPDNQQIVSVNPTSSRKAKKLTSEIIGDKN